MSSGKFSVTVSSLLSNLISLSKAFISPLRFDARLLESFLGISFNNCSNLWRKGCSKQIVIVFIISSLVCPIMVIESSPLSVSHTGSDVTRILWDALFWRKFYNHKAVCLYRYTSRVFNLKKFSNIAHLKKPRKKHTSNAVWTERSFWKQSTGTASQTFCNFPFRLVFPIDK